MHGVNSHWGWCIGPLKIPQSEFTCDLWILGFYFLDLVCSVNFVNDVILITGIHSVLQCHFFTGYTCKVKKEKEIWKASSLILYFLLFKLYSESFNIIIKPFLKYTVMSMAIHEVIM